MSQFYKVGKKTEKRLTHLPKVIQQPAEHQGLRPIPLPATELCILTRPHSCPYMGGWGATKAQAVCFLAAKDEKSISGYLYKRLKVGNCCRKNLTAPAGSFSHPFSKTSKPSKSTSYYIFLVSVYGETAGKIKKRRLFMSHTLHLLIKGPNIPFM